ncbi:hypothetical protein F2Q69_00021545 [Brassica cretica]|uniref:Uncharacterized protein n=1 Tax=Brassica cretica TaxID=69181 RepID=A0A8S9QHI9_BRACR|nr:hypothetical protein F2Q69_00021545 [Brassica cretica]
MTAVVCRRELTCESVLGFALVFLTSAIAWGKNPGANSLLGNFVDEPTSIASTGGNVGAVESMEEGVVSSSESETTKRDDYVFSKTESQTNVQKMQLYSGEDMENLRRGQNRETGFAFGVFGQRRRPEDPAAFDYDTIGAESS